MINLKIKTNGTVRNLTLPYPGQSIPDIIEKNSVVTVSEVTEPESLKYMEGHEWNIDEINFLAKRMESFDKREKRQFDAIASQLKPSTGQDLINQTFNLSRYTLISDFSSLTEIGKTHVINRKQAMSFDEMASTDFAKIGKDLIESGKGIPTAYGVMFIKRDQLKKEWKAMLDCKYKSNYPDKKILTCFLFQFKKIRFANKLSGNIGRCAKFFIQF